MRIARLFVVALAAVALAACSLELKGRIFQGPYDGFGPRAIAPAQSNPVLAMAIMLLNAGVPDNQALAAIKSQGLSDSAAAQVLAEAQARLFAASFVAK